MRTRDYYFKREATVADSDTVVINIDIKDPISFIKVEYEATNGGTSCIDHELHDDVDKIELVDGSDVLFSMSMAEAIALNFFELSKLPHQSLSENLSVVQEESCYIHFGRFQNDPEYYFNPTAWKNPQLRITHTLDISATAGFATGTGKITVMARIIEEGALPYKGFLMSKNKYSWTSGTSGDEPIDMPRDHPYRMMLVKALLTTYRPDEVLSKHKLSCDADKFVPFEMYTEDVMDQNEKQFGLAQQCKNLLTADDGTALLDLYDIRKASIRCNYDDQIATIEGVDAEQVSVGLYNMATVTSPALQTTARVCPVAVEGIAPFGCIVFPFGELNNPESWFDAPSFSDIKLYCTQAVAGACAILLQQLRV